MYPIYIPSKGRYATASTPKHLEQVGFPYTLVVEPHEYEKYQQAFPQASFLVLPLTRQGIAYARNAITAHAYDQGSTWHWVLDDDIINFKRIFYYIGPNSISIPATAEILAEIEQQIPEDRLLAQVGLALTWWREEEEQTWNSWCYCGVLNHARHMVETDSKYRNYVPEDGDLTLQLLAAGYKTLRFGHYALQMPRTGSNSGGLQSLYASGGKDSWSKNLKKLWGTELVQLKRNYAGRTHAIINWKYFQREKK